MSLNIHNTTGASALFIPIGTIMSSMAKAATKEARREKEMKITQEKKVLAFNNVTGLSEEIRYWVVNNKDLYINFHGRYYEIEHLTVNKENKVNIIIISYDYNTLTFYNKNDFPSKDKENDIYTAYCYYDSRLLYIEYKGKNKNWMTYYYNKKDKNYHIHARVNGKFINFVHEYRMDVKATAVYHLCYVFDDSYVLIGNEYHVHLYNHYEHNVKPVILPVEEKTTIDNVLEDEKNIQYCFVCSTGTVSSKNVNCTWCGINKFLE